MASSAGKKDTKSRLGSLLDRMRVRKVAPMEEPSVSYRAKVEDRGEAVFLDDNPGRGNPSKKGQGTEEKRSTAGLSEMGKRFQGYASSASEKLGSRANRAMDRVRKKMGTGGSYDIQEARNSAGQDSNSGKTKESQKPVAKNRPTDSIQTKLLGELKEKLQARSGSYDIQEARYSAGQDSNSGKTKESQKPLAKKSAVERLVSDKSPGSNRRKPEFGSTPGSNAKSDGETAKAPRRFGQIFSEVKDSPLVHKKPKNAVERLSSSRGSGRARG